MSRPLRLRGRQLESVFQLIGTDENSLTFALGWCLSRVPTLLDAMAAEIGAAAPGPDATILLQEHGGKNGITDIEVRDPGKVAWIVEAKIGFEPPSVKQLSKYARSLLDGSDATAEKLLVVLAQSDRLDLWLKTKVPACVEGVPVRVISWGQVKACVDRAYPITDNTGKALLRQLGEFLSEALGMQAITSNEVYVVSISRDTFSTGPTTFMDVVVKHYKYFHPVGARWPVNPPNYIAFRWDGRLQSIHHVDRYEVITSWLPHFPDAQEGVIDPLFLYTLGPAILPPKIVPTGGLYMSARVYAHLDLLLTSATISDARNATQERLQAAAKT